jgi:hypothetical protein
MPWVRALLIGLVAFAGGFVLFIYLALPTCGCEAINRARVALRGLVSLEESAFQRDSTYTANLDSLGPITYGGIVRVTVLQASRDGWLAEARDSTRPGTLCVVWVGNARPLTERDGSSLSEASVRCRGLFSMVNQSRLSRLRHRDEWR